MRGSGRSGGDWLFSIAALVMIALGFYWRLVYLARISLFIDEFPTILAAQMIKQKGIPQLPSGLFYDTGLLFNYVVSAFIGIAGFSEAVARFPSVIFGLLSVAVTYRLGNRFLSPAVALLSSALLALAPEAVMWGGRSRAYAQFQFWTLVGVWALAEGLTGRWRGRWRALFWAAFAGAALSHLAGVVFMLCSVIAALLAWYRSERPKWQPGTGWIRRVAGLWPDGLLAVVVLGGIAALTLAGQPVWIKPIGGSVSATEGLSFSALLQVDWMDALRMIGPILLRSHYLPWTILTLVNAVVLVYRAIKRRLLATDAVALYLQGVWILSIVALTLGSPWHIPRYVFPLLPVFFLLGSFEMANAAGNLSALLFRKRARAGGRWLAGAIVLSVCILMWLPVREVTSRQEYGYDLAFHYVQGRWREGDAVMTFNTSGSYIYLGRCDFYPIQISPWLLDTPDGLVDRYTGARWIESVEQLDAALVESPRMWFVIDNGRFLERIDPEMQEASFARFRSVFHERGVQVFLYERLEQ